MYGFPSSICAPTIKSNIFSQWTSEGKTYTICRLKLEMKEFILITFERLLVLLGKKGFILPNPELLHDFSVFPQYYIRLPKALKELQVLFMSSWQNSHLSLDGQYMDFVELSWWHDLTGQKSITKEKEMFSPGNTLTWSRSGSNLRKFC